MVFDSPESPDSGTELGTRRSLRYGKSHPAHGEEEDERQEKGHASHTQKRPNPNGRWVSTDYVNEPNPAHEKEGEEGAEYGDEAAENESCFPRGRVHAEAPIPSLPQRSSGGESPSSFRTSASHE